MAQMDEQIARFQDAVDRGELSYARLRRAEDAASAYSSRILKLKSSDKAFGSRNPKDWTRYYNRPISRNTYMGLSNG